MPTPKEINVEVTYTKNLGNYESLKLTAGIVLIVHEGERLSDVYKQGWDSVAEQIREQIKLLGKESVRKGLSKN